MIHFRCLALSHPHFLKCPFSSYIQQPLNLSGRDMPLRSLPTKIDPYLPGLEGGHPGPPEQALIGWRCGGLLATLAVRDMQISSCTIQMSFQCGQLRDLKVRSTEQPKKRGLPGGLNSLQLAMLFFQTEELPKMSTNPLYNIL